MERQARIKILIWIPIICWIVLVLTSSLIFFNKENISNNVLSDLFFLVIIFLILLIIISGFISLLGFTLTLKNYFKVGKQYKLKYIISLCLNFTYLIIYILLIVLFAKGIFNGIMSV
jgi:hypothetical protein